MNIRIVNWTPARRSRTIEIFLKRPAFDPEAEKIAAEMLLDIKTRGEPAVLAAIAKYEGTSLKPSELRVSKAEFDDAESKVPERIKRLIDEAHDRVADFSRKSMRRDWTTPTPHGGALGEF